MPAPPKPKIAYKPVPRPRQCPVTPVGSLRAVVSSRAQWDRRGRGGTAAGAVGSPRAQWDRRGRSGTAASAVGSPRAQWDRRGRGGIAAGAVGSPRARWDRRGSSEHFFGKIGVWPFQSGDRTGPLRREATRGFWSGVRGSRRCRSGSIQHGSGASARSRIGGGARPQQSTCHRPLQRSTSNDVRGEMRVLPGTLITMGGTKSHGGPRVRGCWGGGPEVLGFNNVRVSPSTSIRINAVSNAIWGPGTCHEGQGSPGEWQKQQGSRRERASGSCVQRLNKIMSAVLSIYDSGRLVLCRVMTSHRPYAWPRAAPCNQPDQRCPHPPPNPVCRSRAPPRGPPPAARGAAARWPRAGLE
eukprot:gene568-biopygen6137